MGELDTAEEEGGDLEENLEENLEEIDLVEDTPDEDETFDSMVKEFERDTDGKPLSNKIARAVNNIWKKPRDSEGYKNAAKREKKLVNAATHAVQINGEIYAVMSPAARAHDARLKSIQTMLCKAVVLAARLLDEVVSSSQSCTAYWVMFTPCEKKKFMGAPDV